MPRNRRRKPHPARAKRQMATAAPTGRPQAAARVTAAPTASGAAISDETRSAAGTPVRSANAATLGATADPTGRPQATSGVTTAPTASGATISDETKRAAAEKRGAISPAEPLPQPAAPAKEVTSPAKQKTGWLTWLKEKIFGKPKAPTPSIAASTGSTVPSERPAPRDAEPRAEPTRATPSPSRTGTPQTQQGQMVAHPVMIMHPSGRLIPTNMYLISVQPIPPRPPALTHEQQFQSFANWAKKTIDDGVKKFDEHCIANRLTEAEKKQAIALAAKTKSKDLRIAANNRGLTASERKIASAAFTLRNTNAETRAKISAEQQYFSQFDVGKTPEFGSTAKAIAETSKNAVMHEVRSHSVSAPARAETRGTPSRGAPARGIPMAERMTEAPTFGSALSSPTATSVRPMSKAQQARS